MDFKTCTILNYMCPKQLFKTSRVWLKITGQSTLLKWQIDFEVGIFKKCSKVFF